MANEVVKHEAENALAPVSFFVQAAQTFEGVMRIAELMAKCGTMPQHLVGKPADCFRVVVQAAKWRMDPFSVAETTSVVRGKLCYEGKLVHAVLQAVNAIEGRLQFDFSGAGEDRKITVSGTPRGGRVETMDGTVRQWKTDNAKWREMPDDMLIYRGTRQWARRYAPEAMLGVYTPDEIIETQPQEIERPASIKRGRKALQAPEGPQTAPPSATEPPQATTDNRQDIVAKIELLQVDKPTAVARAMRKHNVVEGTWRLASDDKLASVLADVQGPIAPKEEEF